MLKKPPGYAWRWPRRRLPRKYRIVRLKPANVASYAQFLAYTEPPDRQADEHLDDLRTDGHVWPEVEDREYRNHPRGRIWTDEEEKELHRQQEAAAAQENELLAMFVVTKRKSEA